MAVNPPGERSLELLVFKQSVLLISGMQRNPAEDPYHAQFHARADRDPTRSADDANRGKCRRQQCQRIFLFVETENPVYRRIDDDTLDECGHVVSLDARISVPFYQQMPPLLDRADGFF